VAATAVRFWHDSLNGDWEAVADAVRADAMLDDAHRAAAIQHVERLAPWFDDDALGAPRTGPQGPG
jgi:hypothetical protein